MATPAGVHPPHAVDAGAAAAAAAWNAAAAGRLIVQARLLLEPLDRGRVDPGGRDRLWPGGTQWDGPGPESPSESTTVGVSAGPSDRQSAGAPHAAWAEPGWAAVTQALQLVRSEGQWLVEAADRIAARTGRAEADPGRSMFQVLIDSDHPDWHDPQDPPQGCLSGCLS